MSRPLDELELVYLWVDGVYVKAGLEKDKAAVLVAVGGLSDGTKIAYGANSTSSSTSACGGSMTGSARSEDSMGRQPRSTPRRYETHGAAWTALERIYSGSRTIVITK